MQLSGSASKSKKFDAHKFYFLGNDELSIHTTFFKVCWNFGYSTSKTMIRKFLLVVLAVTTSEINILGFRSKIKADVLYKSLDSSQQ